MVPIGNATQIMDKFFSRAAGIVLAGDERTYFPTESGEIPVGFKVRRALSEAGNWTGLRPTDRWERTLPCVWEAEKEGRTTRAVFDFDGSHSARKEHEVNAQLHLQDYGQNGYRRIVAVLCENRRTMLHGAGGEPDVAKRNHCPLAFQVAVY